MKTIYAFIKQKLGGVGQAPLAPLGPTPMVLSLFQERSVYFKHGQFCLEEMGKCSQFT